MGILYDARRVKIFEAFEEICQAAGESKEWAGNLWVSLLQEPDLLKELCFYIEKGAILGKYKREGYTLLDLYVHSMDRYNLFHDVGKNTEMCSKDHLVLWAFDTMIKLIHNPEEMKKKLQESPGMDRLM